MKKIVKFFKQDDKWYADVPNHTLEENEMVMGCDVALEFLSKGNDKLYLTLSTDEKDSLNSYLSFKLKRHDEDGGYYSVNGLLLSEFMDLMSYQYIDDNIEVWICNVTHDVFGEHPDNIYLLEIEF